MKNKQEAAKEIVLLTDLRSTAQWRQAGSRDMLVAKTCEKDIIRFLK